MVLHLRKDEHIAKVPSSDFIHFVSHTVSANSYIHVYVSLRSAPGGFQLDAVKFYAANVVMAFSHLHKRGFNNYYSH